jgi:hypothetical protein
MRRAASLRCSDAVDAKCHPAMCECVAARMRALESVARAAMQADVLHDGSHTAGTKPGACAGCRLMSSLARLAAPKGVR